MNKPSLGFTCTPEMKRAHGHFAQEKFLREGHNTTPAPRGRRVTAAIGPIATVKTRAGVVAKDIDRLSRATARRAIRAGGETAATVAAERPVLAAKIAAKQAGLKGPAARAAIQAARQDPNSRRAERRARRGTAKVPTASASQSA